MTRRWHARKVTPKFNIGYRYHIHREGDSSGYRWAIAAVCNSTTEDGDPYVEEVRALIEAAPALLDAARDALSGWRYIREVHGYESDGVGWDRVEQALTEAIKIADSHKPIGDTCTHP
jgi:hypothetical protein